MRKGRTAVIAGVLGALASTIAAPRGGDTRRAALARLQGWVRRRGGVDAFAGTPCSVGDARPDDEDQAKGAGA